MTVGVLFLLANLGYLKGWDFGRLGDLWPLILVLIGAEILISRSLPPASATIAAFAVAVVAVIGALVYVGMSPTISSAGSTSSSASAPIGTLQQATLDLNVGASTVTIDSAAGSGQLYTGSFRYNPSDTMNAFVDRSSGVVHIDLRNQLFFFGPSGSRSVALSLSNQVPWAININGGASTQTIDLSALKVSGLTINGGAHRTTITLGAANGNVPIEVSGGANTVTIHRPAGTEASIRMSGGVNDLVADGQHQSALAGDTAWESPGYANAVNRYSIQFSGGANHLALDAR